MNYTSPWTQTHLTLYMSYMQRINLLFTCPYYKSCDWRLGAVSLCAPSFKVKWPDKRKRRKRPRAEGTENTWWQKDWGGASPEAYVESMTDYIAKGLEEVLQPYSKNLSGNGPGVYMALNLKLWSGRRSLMSAVGRLWEELHCNQSSFLSFYSLT